MTKILEKIKSQYTYFTKLTTRTVSNYMKELGIRSIAVPTKYRAQSKGNGELPFNLPFMTCPWRRILFGFWCEINYNFCNFNLFDLGAEFEIAFLQTSNVTDLQIFEPAAGVRFRTCYLTLHIQLLGPIVFQGAKTHFSLNSSRLLQTLGHGIICPGVGPGLRLSLKARLQIEACKDAPYEILASNNLAQTF